MNNGYICDKPINFAVLLEWYCCEYFGLTERCCCEITHDVLSEIYWIYIFSFSESFSVEFFFYKNDLVQLPKKFRLSKLAYNSLKEK